MKLPNYEIDGEPVYIPRDSKAWKTEPPEVEDDPMHPITMYYAGETRYRVTDETKQHLDMTTGPEMYVLQEVAWDAWLRLSNAISDCVDETGDVTNTGALFEAYGRLAQAGVRQAVNTNGEVKITARGVSDKTMGVWARNGLAMSIGIAVYRVNQPLSSAEGKQ